MVETGDKIQEIEFLIKFSLKYENQIKSAIAVAMMEEAITKIHEVPSMLAALEWLTHVPTPQVRLRTMHFSLRHISTERLKL